MKTNNLSFKDISLNQYYDLIGRGIQIEFKNGGKKLYSTIELVGLGSKGYYMPNVGLTCSNQHAKSNSKYYYVHIDESGDNIHINVFTSKLHIKYVKLDDLTLELQNSEILATAKFGNVYQYSLSTSKYLTSVKGVNITNIAAQLKGQRFYFLSSDKEELFSCGLGLANPYVNEKDNLYYSFKSLDINGLYQIQKRSLLTFLLISVSGLMALSVIGVLIYCYTYRNNREIKGTLRRIRPSSYA